MRRSRSSYGDCVVVTKQTAAIAAALLVLAIGLFIWSGNLPAVAQTHHIVTLDATQLQAQAGSKSSFLPVPVNEGQSTQLLELNAPPRHGALVGYWERTSNHAVHSERFINGWSLGLGFLGVLAIGIALALGLRNRSYIRTAIAFRKEFRPV